MRKNLQTARKAAGLTQQEMADKLGIGLRHYQKIEYAEINGSFAVWDALEDLLGELQLRYHAEGEAIFYHALSLGLELGRL